MSKQVLDDMEGMLDPRSNLGLDSLDGDQQVLLLHTYRLDLGAFDGNLPLHGLAIHLLALVHARVARGPCSPRRQMHALRGHAEKHVPAHVRLVGRGAYHTVYQSRGIRLRKAMPVIGMNAQACKG
ncbi:protein of unknown function (plasmid) [Cupriavidus taiwanensis]|uniref:Uncharacterized protein n=1 Tax=Cupriavidus taiwanensis TaxID=164546 RepID=A0A375ISM0_9BURK|nr:protein of unknown function [Cupriavidus taiwanensis]